MWDPWPMTRLSLDLSNDHIKISSGFQTLQNLPQRFFNLHFLTTLARNFYLFNRKTFGYLA
jgi:hypothetical protein